MTDASDPTVEPLKDKLARESGRRNAKIAALAALGAALLGGFAGGVVGALITADRTDDRTQRDLIHAQQIAAYGQFLNDADSTDRIIAGVLRTSVTYEGRQYRLVAPVDQQQVQAAKEQFDELHTDLGRLQVVGTDAAYDKAFALEQALINELAVLSDPDKCLVNLASDVECQESEQSGPFTPPGNRPKDMRYYQDVSTYRDEFIATAQSDVHSSD